MEINLSPFTTSTTILFGMTLREGKIRHGLSGIIRENALFIIVFYQHFKRIACLSLKSEIETKSRANVCYCTFFELE